jgi:hypothetical protein
VVQVVLEVMVLPLDLTLAVAVALVVTLALGVEEVTKLRLLVEQTEVVVEALVEIQILAAVA